MSNFASYLLASSYSGYSPVMNTAANCTLNGQIVPCNDPAFGMVFAVFGGIWLTMFILGIVSIIGLWKMYVKAGRPGWAALIPIYNVVVLLEIIGKPTWWVILSFIPFVNAIVGIIIMHNLSKAFGRGIGTTLGLIFLPVIFYLILGFGKAKYVGSSAASQATL